MLDFIYDILMLCVEYQGSVTSWYRTHQHNKDVGGQAESYHLAGLALDVVMDNPENEALFITRAKKLGYMAIKEQTHIHVQIR